MEKTDHLEQWVHERMAASDPAAAWPDLATGRTFLDRRRIAAQPRRVLLWAGATAAVFAAVLALPGPRLAAQRLWDQVFLGRLQVLFADFGGLGAGAGSFVTEAHLPDVHRVASIEEAGQLAGFLPRLPEPDVFPVAPTYSVAGVTSAKLRLPTRVVLEVRAGPVIMADYGGVLLLQSLPFELIKPADFDLELFYRRAFRALGASERFARALSNDLAINPALLMVMPKEDFDLVHEFPTRSGTGVMIEEVYGPGKIVGVWSGSDRLYALYPDTREVTRDFLIRVANALD
jgi:hypothetical protein